MPAPAYLRWVGTVPREDQFISAIPWENSTTAPTVPRPPNDTCKTSKPPSAGCTVLPYDAATAKAFGRLRSTLEAAGTRLDDADLQIGATALHHGLELVTGNLRHFQRIPELRINPALADARTGSV
jgi:hypothetical protein